MSPRPVIVGPDTGPESPFPLRMEGPVISGFGRGSKELGIPTANIPVNEATTPWIADCVSGVYFGWAVLKGRGGPKGTGTGSAEDKPVETHYLTIAEAGAMATTPADGDHGSAAHLYPMVMSIGYNPFYQNTARTAEVHLLHAFGRDFYGAHLLLALLGFIRPERGDYASVAELVEDIRFDCVVSRRSLARRAWTPVGVSTATAWTGADDKDAEDVESAVGTLSVPWLLEA